MQQKILTARIQLKVHQYGQCCARQPHSLSIGLTANIDVPRATEDYMLLPYSIIDASWDFMQVKVKLSPAAMSGGRDGVARGRDGREVN